MQPAGSSKKERSFQDDGCIDGRHPGGQLRPGMAAGEMVPKAGRRTGIIGSKENRYDCTGSYGPAAGRVFGIRSGPSGAILRNE